VNQGEEKRERIQQDGMNQEYKYMTSILLYSRYCPFNPCIKRESRIYMTFISKAGLISKHSCGLYIIELMM
jgi:hypothetical protein